MALSESLVIRSTILHNWHGFPLSFIQTTVRMGSCCHCHSSPESPHRRCSEDSELSTEHCMPLCSLRAAVFLDVLHLFKNHAWSTTIHCPFSFVLFREQNMSNGVFFFFPSVNIYLGFKNKIAVFSCHSSWFSLKRHAPMRRQGSVFSSTENILDRLLGVYLPKNHGYLAHWKDLDAADFFDHQGKYGERRKGNLCVHWFMCVDVSGGDEVFGSVTVCQVYF